MGIVNRDKILLLIFSRNRGAQLDLLLRSIEFYSKDVFEPVILYRYDKIFEGGLDKVRSKFPHYKWVEENNFRQQTLSHLEAPNRTVSCMTDDTVFRRHFAATDKEVAELLDEANIFSLLLRCGLNTIRQCHYTNEMQQPLDIQQVYQTEHLQMASYDFRQHRWETDWGRPVSLDGSISLVCQLRNILEEVPWTNPRELDNVNSYRDKIKGMTGLCEESFVVTQSVNQSFSGPRADNWGHFVQHSLEDLEQKYLDGYVIEMNQEKFLVNTSHVEMSFNFIKE